MSGPAWEVVCGRDIQEEAPRCDVATYWFFQWEDGDRDAEAAKHYEGCDRGNKPARCLDCYGLYRAGYLDWHGTWIKVLW